MNLLLSFVSCETPFSQMGVQRYDFFLYFQIFLQKFLTFLHTFSIAKFIGSIQLTNSQNIEAHFNTQIIF